MKIDNGFSAISQPDATLLILGSMPSVVSLQQQKYYGHPRNHFWPILSKLFDWPDTLSYTERCHALIAEKIALWDVLKSAHRPGSLDSKIDRKHMQINDFSAFFAKHPKINCICFNGRTAYDLFKRHANAHITTTHLLPSTSPAHASMTFEAKLAVWQQALMRH